MTSPGVILYGPPTSGKDTVTAELARQDDRYALLPRLKVGAGRAAGYRYVSLSNLEKLRANGRLVVETHRYGNVYAIDRDDITALVEAGKVPVAHVGNIPDLQRLRAAAPLTWTAVLLWIPRAVCADRSKRRGDADTPKRLQAWDETRDDLQSTATPVFDLLVHTDQANPTETARRILAAVATGPTHPVAVPPDLA